MATDAAIELLLIDTSLQSFGSEALHASFVVASMQTQHHCTIRGPYSKTDIIDSGTSIFVHIQFKEYQTVC